MMGGRKDKHIYVAPNAEKGETLSVTVDALAGIPAPVALSGWQFAFVAFDSSDLPAEGPAAVAEVVAAADIVVSVDIDAVALDVAVAADVSDVADAVVDVNVAAAAVSADVDTVAVASF